MASKSDLQEIIEEMKRLVNVEINGIFTCEFAIVEEIDHDNARVVISHKDDQDVMTDNVPILSAYAGDGYGTIEPLKPGDEGIVMFNMDPTTDILKQEGHIDLEKQRRHSVQDAMFMPRVWLDNYEVPDHEEGERLVFHESGTFFSIKPNGNTVIQHVDGNRLELNSSEGVVETGDENRQISVSADGAEIRVTHPNGDLIRLTANSEGLEVKAADDDLTDVNSITDIGDKDGKRINPSSLNNDSEDPRTYSETSTNNSPIEDPTTTTGINQASIRSQSPVDFGGYEFRNAVPERREQDPDPGVSDPTNPAYFPADEIPVGYLYILTSSWELKAWGSGGSPVSIMAI